MMEFEPKIKESRWDRALERQIFDSWEQSGLYALERNSPKPVWSIDTPPPYASGGWHVGGAMHYSNIDMIARYKRMAGFSVLFRMGIDRNGLPAEIAAEKEFGIRMTEVPREKFLGMCAQILDKYEVQILSICRSLGFSMNSLLPSGVYRTDSPEYRAITQATFIELWKKGLVYEDNRPNNWCTDCRTTIADAEIEYKDHDTELTCLNFEASGKKLEIATTRPELLSACACILVHPTDSRYLGLHNKKALVPIYGKEVPIIPHPSAKPEFGSGAVMVCSYGDYTDVRLFRELGLKPTGAIGPDGKMTEAAGKYAGLRIKQARKAILADLAEMGLVVKQEKVMHRTPVCWRSKTPIEFVSMPEYYLKQMEFVPKILKAIEGVEFHPQEGRQLLVDWVNSVSMDWPISRRRYYGTEIPLWYCSSCRTPVAPEPGNYYRPWAESPPVDKCPKCGHAEFTGETRTFDTWMDSSISELVVCGYMQDDSLFKRSFPCSIRPQGKEIVRTWLFYTLLRAYQLLGAPAFRHVWISGLVMDEKGEKMSKSIGNVVYPEPMLEKYGADAFRYLAASEASLGSDIRFSEEKLRGASKFVQKLFNLSRFISSFPQADRPAKLEAADEWILAELGRMVGECEAGYERLDFFVPSTRARSFAWELFADHYVELVKARAYNRENHGFSKEAQESAWFTLHECLKTVLKALAPIMPFVTEHVWLCAYGPGSLHVQQFPQAGEHDKELLELTPKITGLNGSAWKSKKDKGVSMKEPLPRLEIPKELEPMARDLKAMHNAVEVAVSG